MDKQQEERNKIQEEAVRLSKEHKHLLLEWATGTGKGLAIAKCIAASKSPKPWLIVVPEIIQIENYRLDLVKHGMDFLTERKIVHIICYASLHHYIGRAYNIHFNEVQHLSEVRLQFGFTFDFDQIISDSATIPKEVEDRLKTLCPFYKYELDVNEAIERGILPAPSVHLIKVFPNSVIKRNPHKYKRTNTFITDKNKIAQFDRAMKNLVELEEKLIKENIEKTGDDSPIPWIGRKLNLLGGERKKFIAYCKNEAVEKLINQLGDRRYIVFCGSVEQSEKLGGNRSINSSRGMKHNKGTIEKFNNKEINSLFFNKMGKEGMNFLDIEAGIIIQLDSGNDQGLSFIQKMGRVFRAISPDIYIFYCPNTQDEIYLKKALKNIDKQYVIKQ